MIPLGPPNLPVVGIVHYGLRMGEGILQFAYFPNPPPFLGGRLIGGHRDLNFSQVLKTLENLKIFQNSFLI